MEVRKLYLYVGGQEREEIELSDYRRIAQVALMVNDEWKGVYCCAEGPTGRLYGMLPRELLCLLAEKIGGQGAANAAPPADPRYYQGVESSKTLSEKVMDKRLAGRVDWYDRSKPGYFRWRVLVAREPKLPGMSFDEYTRPLWECVAREMYGEMELRVVIEYPSVTSFEAKHI